MREIVTLSQLRISLVDKLLYPSKIKVVVKIFKTFFLFTLIILQHMVGAILFILIDIITLIMINSFFVLVTNYILYKPLSIFVVREQGRDIELKISLVPKV